MPAEQPEEFRLTVDDMLAIVAVLQKVRPREEQFTQFGAIMEKVLMDWPKPLVTQFMSILVGRIGSVSDKKIDMPSVLSEQERTPEYMGY